MSAEKKAEALGEALALLIECRDFLHRVYRDTPGRNEILMKIDNYEERLLELFYPEKENDNA